MRRLDRVVQSVNSSHKRESYIGPLASTNAGGHNANVNNLHNSQVRDAKTIMPYGISSRAPSGVKAQAIVNGNNDNTVVGVYDKNRPEVDVGEICLYTEKGGNSVYLQKDGTITIKNKKASISLNPDSGDITMRTEGNINIDCNRYNVTQRSTS